MLVEALDEVNPPDARTMLIDQTPCQMAGGVFVNRQTTTVTTAAAADHGEIKTARQINYFFCSTPLPVSVPRQPQAATS